MRDDLFFAGIDCGATKVMVQSSILDDRSNKITPDKFQKEYFYSDHEKWKEINCRRYCLWSFLRN